MGILDYYKEQQNYKDWYDKFQSTAGDKSGKVFSYTSTTYRNINNFLKDLDKFRSNNGVSKSEWITYENGQHVDKQRTLPLTSLGLIRKDIDTYYFTGLGYTCSDIIESDMLDSEKWLSLYLILLNYQSKWRENDIVLTAKEQINYLLKAGVNEEEILNGLVNVQRLQSIDEVMKTDIFWYITFAKDKKFIEIYVNSTESERDLLYAYVINEQQKPNSKDCIGHKYKPGGQMLLSTFMEECKVLFISYKLMQSKYEDFDSMLNRLIDIYREISVLTQEEKLRTFINNHISIYEDIYNKSILRREDNEQ